ncbi:MAG TPA: nuclear transport factor 2 family protein [Solirubrobacterales bacterium]|jgi:ketosteroid isomerase-like protein
MSQENAEIVRRIYEQGLLDQHPEQLAALVTPDVEYVNPPEALEPGIRRGRTELARALRNVSEPFDSYRYEFHELFKAGDAVVASVSCHARSFGSETELVQEEAHTWTLRDGKIVRFEWGRDLGTALEAAGLSD